MLLDGKSVCFIETCSGETQSISCVSRNEPSRRDSKEFSICDFRGSVFKCDDGSTYCGGTASLICRIDEKEWAFSFAGCS